MHPIIMCQKILKGTQTDASHFTTFCTYPFFGTSLLKTKNNNCQPQSTKLGTTPGWAPSPTLYLCKWRPNCLPPPPSPSLDPKNTPISALCPRDVCQDGLHTKNKQASHCNSKRNGCGFGRGGRRREEGWSGKKEAGSGYT